MYKALGLDRFLRVMLTHTHKRLLYTNPLSSRVARHARAQHDVADSVRRHRDGLIMFLERLGDGTERWMRLRDND